MEGADRTPKPPGMPNDERNKGEELRNGRRDELRDDRRGEPPREPDGVRRDDRGDRRGDGRDGQLDDLAADLTDGRRDVVGVEGGEGTPERLKGVLSRLVGMTAAQAQRVSSDALRAIGAHKDHFVVLAALEEFGPASQAAVAGRARVYKSDLVAVLNDLADGGWIRRAPDPADKRRNVISITAAGRARLDELDAVLADVNNHITAPLTPAERTQLFTLLTRINSHLSTSPNPPNLSPKRSPNPT